MYYKTALGRRGEEVAIQYLLSRDYKIIERNFRTRFGEIDIIAKEKNELVFIEVKTRSSGQYGEPCEAVDDRKIKHILRVAEYYIYIKRVRNIYIRFDVIEVKVSKEKFEVNHIKQVL